MALFDELLVLLSLYHLIYKRNDVTTFVANCNASHSQTRNIWLYLATSIAL